MCAVAEDARLQTELRRWQSAGLLTADQVAAIVEFEQARPAEPDQPVKQPADRRVTVVEVLAYLGAVVTLAGVLILLGSRYSQLGSAGRLSVVALVTVAAASAALLLGRRAWGAAGNRARAAALGLASLGFAALVFQVQVEQAGGSLASASNRMVLIGAVVGSVLAAGLIVWTGSGLLAFLMSVGVYVSAIAVAAMHTGAYNAWALWGVFAAAGTLLVVAAEAARQRRMRWPPEVLAFSGLIVPVILAYIAPQAGRDLSLEVLGAVLSLAGFGAAVLRSSAGYAIAGAIGAFAFVLEVQVRHFQGSLGFALILVTSGLALLGIAYLTARLLPRLARN